MNHHSHLRRRRSRGHIRHPARHRARHRHIARRLVQAAEAGEQLSPAEIALLREHQRDLEQRAADIAGLLDRVTAPTDTVDDPAPAE